MKNTRDHNQKKLERSCSSKKRKISPPPLDKLPLKINQAKSPHKVVSEAVYGANPSSEELMKKRAAIKNEYAIYEEESPLHASVKPSHASNTQRLK